MLGDRLVASVGIAGIWGRATLVFGAAVVTRFICVGALMVCCFFCICTLCSRLAAAGADGAEAAVNVALLLALIVCTMYSDAPRPRSTMREDAEEQKPLGQKDPLEPARFR